jgi:hypothetical protein
VSALIARSALPLALLGAAPPPGAFADQRTMPSIYPSGWIDLDKIEAGLDVRTAFTRPTLISHRCGNW